MIIRQQDLDSFIEEYSDFQTDYRFARESEVYFSDPDFRFLHWLNKHPEVLMAADYLEFISARRLSTFRRLAADGSLENCPRPAFMNRNGLWVLPSVVHSDRTAPWEAYYLPQSAHELEISEIVTMPSADKIIAKARKCISIIPQDPTVFISPRLWIPGQPDARKAWVQRRAVQLLGAIKDEKMSLADLSWRQFEDIIEEILKTSGLQVVRVQTTPQGGRDLIMRGELVPGTEPVSIAVEVKHKELVDRPDVQLAIQQNRVFPALMFVTSGRFTAGVFQERELPENRMRLFLKDGVAIAEMIKAHPL